MWRKKNRKSGLSNTNFLSPTPTRASMSISKQAATLIQDLVQGTADIPAHSSRDMLKAIEYYDKYHSNYDGTSLQHPLSDAILNQVNILIASSKRMGSLNFFYFDKCPPAVIYFIRNYLNELEPILDKYQITEALKISSILDPMERIERIRKLVTTNKNSSLIKRILIFLNSIVNNSASYKTTIDCLIKLFYNCLFRINSDKFVDTIKQEDMSIREQKLIEKNRQKRKLLTRFLIQRALLIFTDNNLVKDESVNSIPALVTADRKLGTDGILYLLERQLEGIISNLTAMNYTSTGGLETEFLRIDNEIAGLSRQVAKLAAQQQSFETSVTDTLKQTQLLVDNFESTPLPEETEQEEYSSQNSDSDSDSLSEDGIIL